MGQNDFARAEKLREIMRRETDTALRQIEPERKPHRPAEPSIVITFRRPGAFDETAEHDAIAFGQAGFKETEDAHAEARTRCPAHNAAGQGRGKQLDIIALRD